MKALLLLCFLLHAGFSFFTAAPVQPLEADFIPVDARNYFPAAKVPQFWGRSVRGWRVALHAIADRSYVVGGGLGELIPVNITVFTDSPDWEKWSKAGPLDFHLVVSGPRLRTLRFDRRLSSGSFSGCRRGSCWTFATEIPLRDLAAAWGELPDFLSAEARLSGVTAESVVSANPSFNLTGIPLGKADIYQRVASLSPGQSKAEVLRIAGQPEKTTFLPRTASHPKDGINLEFRDPNLSKFASDKSLITVQLDTDGKVLSTFICIMCGC
jgi:hypothetical protein